MAQDPREMGFLEHLDELRTRIIRSCIAIGAGTQSDSNALGWVVAAAAFDQARRHDKRVASFS